MTPRFYDITQCPLCRGTGENPAGERCPRCEGFGNLEICLATKPGQREDHDLAQCGHYMNVGQHP